MGWPMKSFGSFLSSTYTSPIPELLGFVWNLATPIKSGCSIWLTFEVAICEHMGFVKWIVLRLWATMLDVCTYLAQSSMLPSFGSFVFRHFIPGSCSYDYVGFY